MRGKKGQTLSKKKSADSPVNFVAPKEERKQSPREVVNITG